MYAKDMPTQLKGTVSVWSNSPDAPTGYGVQVSHLLPRLKRAGLDVAMLSNYGQEGSKSTIKTPHGKIPHFPRGLDAYSNDVAPIDHLVQAKKYPDQKDLFISLYDVWVMTSENYKEINSIASWVPFDHINIPPKVEKWLRKDNVTPIAMAPNGSRDMEAKGIEHLYIPHSVDTSTYKPTSKEINGKSAAEYLGSKDKFLVGIVAANKASGMTHRKAFGENLLAFSLFQKKHPDAMLYIHTEPHGLTNGWNIFALLDACGIDKSSVVFPHPLEYRFGYDPKHLATLYTEMDVLLATSLGEGFGVPAMEAQACGTRVIGSNWAATPDLVSDESFLVDGQPLWDSAQLAWWKTPSVPAIVEALERAYNSGSKHSQKSVEFAQQFDVEKVWQKYWMPALEKLLS